MRIGNAVSLAVIALIVVSFCQPAFAEDDRELVVIPYLWVAGLSGDQTVDGNEASVSLSADEILDALDFGGMLHVESRKGKWGAFFDGSYVKLSTDGKVGPFDVDASTELALVELGIFYRLLEASSNQPVALDILGGGRYYYLEGDLDIKGAGPLGVDIEVDKSKDWVDAIIGGRIQFDLTEKLAFSLRGDAGGFDIGSSSDLVWNLVAALGYDLSDRTTLWLGYRHLDVDYDDGSGVGQFEYDVEMTGPIVGLAIRF
jgi:hypothetical protein